ncbi:MAG: diphosphomevalonate decarboxylase [Bdellovibrionales bacterium]|nr:diphosphomevalonate decarboxylase [Bdellovibrionales bacterium]
MYWEALAPSNLALIKYAGKKDKNNLPLNSSLSYTLDHLTTKVRVTPIEDEKDKWRVLESKGSFSLTLSSSAIERFLRFFQFLKKAFKVPGAYLIQSANCFPASIGAASSASSFCALTQATYQMALSRSSNPSQVEELTSSCLSVFSRHGSGSSCRSFFRPWAIWDQEGEGARAIETPFPYLIHQLLVVDLEHKGVSSSLAHEKIIRTTAFKGRIDRAQKRLSSLLSALNERNWARCFEITWDEFQDLHHLYEAAGIFYRNEKSYKILDIIKAFWETEKDGPLVTMDAGSSIHLLYRPDQTTAVGRLYSLVEGLVKLEISSGKYTDSV